MKYQIDNMGVETYHGPGFSHQLPNGFPFWVFLHMITPHKVNEGETLRLAEAGTCIVYPPSYPRYLYTASDSEGLCNNWTHFSTDDDLFLQKLTDYRIPILQFFTLKQSRPVVSILEEISYEFSLDQPHREQMISYLMETLLIRVSRNIRNEADTTNPTVLVHMHDFEKLRKEMYLHPEKNWTCEGMAAQAFLAQNRFIILYRTFFNTTPKQDLLNARIQKAKTMLGSSTTIKDVAAQSGFANEYYFSTAFKRAVGVTPGQYIAANCR
mgnify:CR=1 FL=1